MTTPHDVIDSYVADVAMRLPIRKRADIARELRGLLREELAARADAAGQPLDEAMARQVLVTFGKASDIAASYRTGDLVIIPPDRATRFVASATTGVALQWALGILVAASRVSDGLSPALAAQQWFLSFGLGALWWPGFMVTCAAIMAWRKAGRQEEPAHTGEKQMTNDRLKRIGAGVALPVALFFTIFYAAPDWFVGQIAPWMQLSWITYVPEFRDARLWAMLAYMAGNVVVLANFAFQGFEAASSRQFAIVMNVVGALALGWCALGGQALVEPAADELFRLILLVLAGVALIDLWRRTVRERLITR